MQRTREPEKWWENGTSYTIIVFCYIQAERDKMEREKAMRIDLEGRMIELEERLQLAQKQAKMAYQRQVYKKELQQCLLL